MSYVKAKKHLGQHFLKNEDVAMRIAESPDMSLSKNFLEIGPGMGVLTKYFLDKPHFYACEVDTESITYLKNHYPKLSENIISGDFLKMELDVLFKETVSIIGNFPYNISSQILFKVLEYKDLVPQVVGMFQKEVAERICGKPGSKQYGILSVLLQAYYDCEYLFTVGEQEFIPPPKVKSGVIRLTRNNVSSLQCNEKLFKQIVKAGFNLRRKTLRNSLKQLCCGQTPESELFTKRPEQLNVEEFTELTNIISQLQKGGKSEV